MNLTAYLHFVTTPPGTALCKLEANALRGVRGASAGGSVTGRRRGFSGLREELGSSSGLRMARI
jgi:hypothetical protein